MMTMVKDKILISACLAGQPVRYNGTARTLADDILATWTAAGCLVPVCPECAGGMPVPRPAAEIQDGCSGEDVLDGRARVVDCTGQDVTDEFLAGARDVLRTAQENNCRFALLTEGSPSCGSLLIYDGSFAGRRHSGEGVTTALLRRAGIEVFGDVTTLQKRMEAGKPAPQ